MRVYVILADYHDRTSVHSIIDNRERAEQLAAKLNKERFEYYYVEEYEVQS